MRLFKDHFPIILAALLFVAVLYPTYADHMTTLSERIDNTFGAFIIFKAGRCGIEQFSILKMDEPNQYHAWHWYGEDAKAWVNMMEQKAIFVVDGVRSECV